MNIEIKYNVLTRKDGDVLEELEIFEGTVQQRFFHMNHEIKRYLAVNDEYGLWQYLRQLSTT